MKRGDKVVCIDDVPCRTCGFSFPLREGSVYVVREVYDTDPQSITVVGVMAPSCHGRHLSPEASFAIYRFRLLDDLKAESVAKQKTCKSA